MANLIYAISASLDGYIADKSGNIDWTEISDDGHRFFNDLQQSVGTMLCGRRMYETMRVWDTYDVQDLPPVSREFAEAWLETDKIVYSSTLDAVPEARTRIQRTFDPEAVRAMKETADRDISIAGAVLAAAAIREGLVDRYQLRVLPHIIGGGTSALPDDVRLDLTLNTTRRFDDGSVLLDYSLR
jgi:dihydrofolate reductase